MKVGVIGLGRFGYNVATTLSIKGIEVLAIDNNEDIISSIRDSVTQAVCINITDEKSLRSVGADEMDIIIVAMGENFAQSTLITALLKKRLKIPRVITRSINNIHREIVTLIGADETIIPEEDIGIRLAEQISSPFSHFFRLTEQFSVSQLQTPPSFIGIEVSNLEIFKNYKVRCIAVKKEEDFIPIEPGYAIQEGDMLLMAGREEDLKKIARLS